jgi:hypothetical protein
MFICFHSKVGSETWLVGSTYHSLSLFFLLPPSARTWQVLTAALAHKAARQCQGACPYGCAPVEPAILIKKKPNDRIF